MPREFQIPPHLDDTIAELAGKGWAARKISDWLKANGISASFKTVYRRLEKIRESRQVVSTVAAQEHLGGEVIADLEGLQLLEKQAEAMADEYRHSPGVRLKAMELQFRILDRKLHYSGVGMPKPGEGQAAPMLRIILTGDEN